MADGQASAGWYDDPDDPSQLRYWDGRQWTDDRATKQGQVERPPPPPVAQTAGSSWDGGRIAKWLAIAGVVGAILLALVPVSVSVLGFEGSCGPALLVLMAEPSLGQEVCRNGAMEQVTVAALTMVGMLFVAFVVGMLSTGRRS